MSTENADLPPPTRITRAEALKRAEDRGAIIDERTLDRYRDHGLVTTHRPQDRPFVVELDTAEVDALIRALVIVDAEATPTTKRIARIRELMNERTEATG